MVLVILHAQEGDTVAIVATTKALMLNNIAFTEVPIGDNLDLQQNEDLVNDIRQLATFQLNPSDYGIR
jgi:hypothetical protein